MITIIAMTTIAGKEKKNHLLVKFKGKISPTEIDSIILLATRKYSLDQISAYLGRSRSLVVRTVNKYRDTIVAKQMDEILSPLESTALDKALKDKDSLMIRFLLSKYRPEMYGDKLEVSAVSNPSKIRIKSTSGKLLESIDKPEDQG